MTTIAFKASTMAADSRSSDPNEQMHTTDCIKIVRLTNGALVGAAGDDDDREVIELLEQATPNKMPSRKKLAATETDFAGIVVFPSGQVFKVEIAHDSEIGWIGSVSRIKDSMCAVGTGAPFAYGAMEAGATAEEAVAIACRRDLNSALPVQSHTIGPTP